MPINQKDLMWSVGGGFVTALIPFLAMILMGINPLLISLAFFFLLPLCFLFLSKGSKIGGIATAVSAFSLLLWGSSGFIFLFIITALPLYFFIEKALLWRKEGNKTEYYPESLLVRWFSLSALIICLGSCLIFLFTDKGGLIAKMAQVSQQLGELSPDQHVFLETIIQFFPTIITLNWALILFINGAIAQKVLEKRDLALRPQFLLENVRTDELWLYALAISGLIGFLLDGVVAQVALNLTFALMIPFWFVGLGTLHYLAKQEKYLFKGAIWGVYVLIFLIPLSHLIIVALGIFEPWIQLRTRLSERTEE